MGDVVESVVDTVADTVEDVAETAYDYGSSAASTVGGGAWDTALGAISVVNDITPDVPFVSLNTSGGQLGVGVDVAGYGAGIDVGEHGVSGNVDAGLFSAEAGVTDQGWNVGVQIGDTDWPSYLPALSFGAKGDYDGNVDGSFEGQGAIPIPGVGLVVAETAGQFHRSEDGTWGVAGQVKGDYYGLDGTRAGGSLYGGYAKTADGSVTTAGGSGYISSDGLSASASVDYSRIEKGDDIIESLDAAAQFKGYGFEGAGRIDYDHAVVDGNEVTSFDAAGKISGHGVDAAGKASYDELTTADGQSVSDWDTEYSVKGLDDLVGDSTVGSLAHEAGVTFDQSSGEPAAQIESDVDQFIAQAPPPDPAAMAAETPPPEVFAAAAEPEAEAAPADELEAGLEDVGDY
jgi:hypothetical protein